MTVAFEFFKHCSGSASARLLSENNIPLPKESQTITALRSHSATLRLNCKVFLKPSDSNNLTQINLSSFPGQCGAVIASSIEELIWLENNSLIQLLELAALNLGFSVLVMTGNQQMSTQLLKQRKFSVRSLCKNPRTENEIWIATKKI